MSKKTLKLVKGVYSYEYMDSFENFFVGVIFLVL